MGSTSAAAAPKKSKVRGELEILKNICGGCEMST